MTSAATLTLPHSSTVSSPVSSTPVPSKNYLDRCVEEVQLSSGRAKKMDQYATLLKVRTYFLVFGLLIPAAFAAMVLTGIYAPVYVPLVAITITWASNIVLPYFRKKISEAYAYKESAEQIRAIAQEYQTLQQRSTALVHADLLALAPTITYGQHERFKPLLAHYNYWKLTQKNCATEMRDQIQEAKKTDKRKMKKRIEHYTIADFKRQEMLQAKVNRAFIIAVMNNPNFQGRAEDICKIENFKLPVDSAIPYKENPREESNQDTDTGAIIQLDTAVHESPWLYRALYREFGDKDAEAFVIFNKKEIEPITSTEVEELTTKQLAMRILRAM